MEHGQLITLTADIVSAHVANNTVAVGDVAVLVQKVHEALTKLGEPSQEAAPEKNPAVSVRASLKPDFIVCMECGRKQRTLKRHLKTAHGMTPDQYRQDYGLPRDYPMVAPNYSKMRGDLARASGLGRKRGGSAGGNEGGGGEAAPAAKPRRGRKPKAA